MAKSHKKLSRVLLRSVVKAEIYLLLFVRNEKFNERNGLDEMDAGLTGLGIMAAERRGII